MRTFVIVMVLALAVAVPAAASHQFSDVPTNHPHHAGVDWLVTEGITSGCGEDTFCPGASLSRAQFATMLRSYDQTRPAPTATTVRQHVVHSSGSGLVECPVGTFVVGGGFLFSGQEQHQVTGSHPVARADGFQREGWYVGVNSNGSIGSTSTWAVCLEVSE